MTLQANQEGTSSPSQRQEAPPPSPAEQLQSEFRERLNKGLQRTSHQRIKDEVADSDVVDETAEEEPAPVPKELSAPSSKGKVSESGTKTGQRTSESGDDKDAKASGAATDAGPEGEDEGEKRAPQPRYDSRSFGAWVTRNPEKAAELAAKVFKTHLGPDPEGWKKHFIAAENKRRRMNEGIEKERAAVEAEKAEVQKVAKETLGAVQPILAVIEAESKSDFPAIDLFIEQTFGISFNEYCTRRLRGSSKETAAERAAKLKAEKLEKELAERKAGKTEPDKSKDEPKAPKVSESWIASELPEDHGARDLKDWQSQVVAAYQDSYDEDTEEYGLTIEDAADKVLAAFLKKRGLSAESQKKQVIPGPKRKPVKVHDDEDEERTPARDLDDKPPADLTERVRWALARAERRR